MIIKDKKVGRSSILRQYYSNLIRFKLTELKIINNYNLNNMMKRTYHINKQIYSKVKKLKKKILNPKIMQKNNKFKIFNNKLKLMEEKILLISKLIKAYNSIIIINKKLQYINKRQTSSNFLKMLPSYIQRSVKRFSDFKFNIININLIQKLPRLTKAGKEHLSIIQLFQKNKKFKNIFKHFINKIKSRLLCKLDRIN
jgi:hypothetical protein